MLASLVADLESTAPGPELAVLLSTVDRSLLDGPGLTVLLQARARQLDYDQAQLLAEAVELASVDWHTPAGVVARMDEPDEFSVDRIAWALTWSVPAAKAYLGLARDLLGRLPAVYAALEAGRIDLARARVFHDMLLEVADAVATVVVAKLIGKAAGWTCGQLRQRLRYWLHKADPQWVSRRYRQAVTRREVRAGTSPDGTAYIFGNGLPVDRAAAADDYLTRLARAAKSAGDVRSLAQLRTDAYLDLLTGMTFCAQPSCDPVTAHADTDHRTEQAELARLATQWSTQPTRQPFTADDDVDERESGRFIPAHLVHDPHDIHGAPLGTAHLSAACCLARDTFGRPNTTNPTLNVGGPPAFTRDGGAPGEQPPTNPSPGHRAAGPRDTAGGQPPGHPDQPPGIPTEHPPLDARQCCRCGGVRVGDRRATVTITMTLQTLTGMTDDPAVIPGWGPVLAEIARNVALDQNTTPSWEYAITDQHGRLLHCGPIRRRPYAQHQRFTRLRDLTCRAPNCRWPAAFCDTDHRKAYTSGGTSNHHNLEPLCRRHHRLKHEKNLTLHHRGDGAYEWHAPNGETWHVPADEPGLLTADDPPQ
jgi:hypothetical protein